MALLSCLSQSQSFHRNKYIQFALQQMYRGLPAYFVSESSNNLNTFVLISPGNTASQYRYGIVVIPILQCACECDMIHCLWCLLFRPADAPDKTSVPQILRYLEYPFRLCQWWVVTVRVTPSVICVIMIRNTDFIGLIRPAVSVSTSGIQYVSGTCDLVQPPLLKE